MPADDVRVLVVKLPVTGGVDAVPRVLRHVPDVD